MFVAVQSRQRFPQRRDWFPMLGIAFRRAPFARLHAWCTHTQLFGSRRRCGWVDHGLMWSMLGASSACGLRAAQSIGCPQMAHGLSAAWSRARTWVAMRRHAALSRRSPSPVVRGLRPMCVRLSHVRCVGVMSPRLCDGSYHGGVRCDVGARHRAAMPCCTSQP
nr:MAG TPA: hypothetical protein [Caudoviricetes sp.]